MGVMDEKLLSAFLTVAEEGSVSGAARLLRVTQPALTRQIQRLEHGTGLELFRRQGSHLVLTAAGEQFRPVANRLHHEHQHAERFVKMLSTGTFSEIEFAAPGTTLIDIVIPFVATMGTDQGRASVVETSLDSSLTEAVLSSDLVVMPASPPDDLASIPLIELPVWAYVAHEHPLAALDDVDLQTLVEQPLVMPSRDFKSRRVFDGALEVSGLNPREYTETNSGRVAQALVATGDGVAVVTEDPVFDLKPIRVLLENRALSVGVYAVWRRDHFAANALESIANQLKDFVHTKYPEGAETQKDRP